MDVRGSTPRTLLLLAALLIPTAMAGCDSASAPTGMQVRFYTPASGVDPYEGVAFLRFLVEGDGLRSPVAETIPYNPSGQTTLENIPFGSGRQVVMEGWSATPSGTLFQVVSRGRSVKSRVEDGGFTQVLTVLFARVNSFVPVSDAAQGLSQELARGRVGHSIVKAVTGEVVIAGGGIMANAGARWWDAEGLVTLDKTIEVVDQRTNVHRQHPNSMFFDRAWHASVGLATGQVLFAGGWSQINDQRQALQRVEIYDPGATGRVQVLANDMATPRAGHTATVIDDASFTVLFVGGDVGASCASVNDCGGSACLEGRCAAEPTFELWNPVSGSMGVRPLPDGFNRRHHTATLFAVPGRVQPAVLITGGEGASGLVASTLIYDVATDVMFLGSDQFSEGRTQHTATYIPGRGYIYVIGGYTSADRSTATRAIEVYDIGREQFRTDVGGFRLNIARGGHAAALLPSNSVVVSGGTTDGGQVLDSIEVVFEYLDPVQGSFIVDVALSANEGLLVPFLPGPRLGQRAVALDNGTALLVGGAQQDGGNPSMPTDLFMYNPP